MQAYHFLLLAQRQLYAGQVDEAMRTAQRLREYEQVLDAAEIYSLVALTAFHAKFYGQCSRALIKLEALPLPAEQHEAYEQLALAIFTRFTPEDPAVRRLSCSKCDASVNDWSAQAPIRLVRRPASTTPRCARCAVSPHGRPLLATIRMLPSAAGLRRAANAAPISRHALRAGARSSARRARRGSARHASTGPLRTR